MVAAERTGVDRYCPTLATNISISYATRPTSASSVPSTAMHAPLPPAVTRGNPLHLDDGLTHGAPTEPAARPAGETVQAGRDGGEVFGVLPHESI